MRAGRLTWFALLAASLIACGGDPAPDHTGPVADWRHYGGDQGGQRFSPLTQVTPENVSELEVAWIYRTGDVSAGTADFEPSTATSPR